MTVLTRSKINAGSSAVGSGSVDTGLLIREVKDFIPIASRTDTQFLQLLGAPKVHDKVEIEFGEGDIVGRTVQINGAIANGVITTLVVDTPQANRVQKWDVIRFLDENILITETPANATTFSNVIRGFGSTSGAAIADNTVGRVLGPAVPEGADAPTSPVQGGQTFINYMQIMEYTFKLTHRARVIKNYEFMTDQFKAQLAKKMKEAALDLNITALMGAKNAGSNDEIDPSATGGVLDFTSTYALDLDAGGTAEPLELLDIMDTLQDVFQDVGRDNMGKTIMGSIFSKRVWDSFFSNVRREYTGKDDIARADWDIYRSSFGDLKFVVNYDMDDDLLLALNLPDCNRLVMEGGNWTTGVYATAGWYEHGFLRGDFGFEWEADRRRAKIFDYSTNSADYPNLDVL